MTSNQNAARARTDATVSAQVIKFFGRELGITDVESLSIWQNEPRYTIFITEVKGRGRYAVRYLDGGEHIVLVSRQPLLDCARLFLFLGANPQATIAMRRSGSSRDDMFAPIAVAARYTVDEVKTVFAKWKPFPLSAVAPKSAPKSDLASEVPNPRKSTGRSGRRKPSQSAP